MTAGELTTKSTENTKRNGQSSSVAATRLGDIINLKRGYDLPANKRKEGLYPVLSSSGISGYHNEFKVAGPGVVTGRYGTLGEVYFVDGHYWPHNTALYVTDFKGNTPRYVYYLLKCLGNLQTADKSAVPGVNRNDLHERSVPFVRSPDTQKKIAAVLSALDAKIELNHRINAELEAMAKTLYDYWFVQFDFPYDFTKGQPAPNGQPYKSSGGKMVYNPTLKRPIPAGWTHIMMRDLLHNCTSAISADVVDADAFYTPIDSLPMKKMSFGRSQMAQDAKTSLIEYKANDILIGAMRVYFHRVCIAPRCGITRTTTMVLRPKRQDLLPYLYQVCNEDRTISAASKLSVGTQQPYINWENTLECHVVPDPPDSLAEMYSLPMNKVVQQVIDKEVENQQLTELRDWLLPMLMNGQVQVE